MDKKSISGYFILVVGIVLVMILTFGTSQQTRSAYVVNAFDQDWIGKWVKNGWKNSAKAEVANSDLWKELIGLTAKHTVTFHKVKGHSDNEFNNRCDELAVAEWKKISEGKN